MRDMKIRKMVLAALMAALTYVATMVVQIPSPMQGYVNLSCDRIIVLHEGELSDVGTHAELMERSQIYRDVYDSQMREEGEQHGQS